MNTSTAMTQYNKENPFPATLLNNVKLSKDGSGKETRHFEISIKGSGIQYKCGDALAVLPNNNLDLVNELLECKGYSGEETVTWGEGETGTLKDVLITKFNLQYITPDLLQKLSDACTDEGEKNQIEQFLDPQNKISFKEKYFDVLDVLCELALTKIPAQALVDSLKLLKPRLYSIASSATQYPDEVHLCIVINNSFLKGRVRKGVTSNYISHAIGINDSVPVYIQSTKHFVLPDEKGIPIIMIGPGTGIAPFRGYLQERVARNDNGDNWLIFGEQHKAFDYLYGEEFEAAQAKGNLQKFDTAFSRDQEHKIYVQDKIKESASEFFQWLERGAIVYVCGDAKRMAVDVDNMIHEVIATEGKMDADAAKGYVKQMKKDKRYIRDIY